MGEEQIITFDTAKLAKEKGFNLSVQTLYNDLGYTLNNGFYPDTHHEDIPAPTQSLLQKWLREVHGIDVIALPTFSSKYIFRLYQKGTTCKNQIYGGYMSKDYANYENALEKGLQEALKLI